MAGYKTKVVITDLRVELDPPRYCYGWNQDMLAREARLKEWARDIEDFIRDHRSQDPVSISVIRETKTICVSCEDTPDPDVDGRPCCCEDAIWEWEAYRYERAKSLLREAVECPTGDL